MYPALVLGLTCMGLCALAVAIEWAYRRRAAQILKANPESQAWVVYIGWSGRILVLSPQELALLPLWGQGRRWNLSQLTRVEAEPVAVGQRAVFHRSGLSVRFGAHQRHEELGMLFPRLGGFWSSAKEAAAAKYALDAARRHQRTS